MSENVAHSGAPRVSANRRFADVDMGASGVWILLIVGAAIVLPPFYYLIQSSFSVPLPGFKTAFGYQNYERVIALNGWRLWSVTLAFAAGSSVLAIFLGFSVAWLVARTNVPFRQTVYIGAFLSLAAPLLSQSRGNPLRIVYPTDGTLAVYSPSAIPKNAPHPNAAKLFMEFAAGPGYASLTQACEQSGVK